MRGCLHQDLVVTEALGDDTVASGAHADVIHAERLILPVSGESQCVWFDWRRKERKKGMNERLDVRVRKKLADEVRRQSGWVNSGERERETRT